MIDNTNQNKAQFFILLVLGAFILADKLPVLFDVFNNIENYRLHDGFGDAIKDILYLIISIVVLITMKARNSKSDLIVVLCFNIGLLICVPMLGISRFILISIVTICLIGYIIFSLINKLINNANH